MKHEYAKQYIPKIEQRITTVPFSGCWLWTGGYMSNGYGIFKNKKDRSGYGAHRLSYAAFVGDIPEGLCVLHKCDVRPCINPDHLFLGTKKENSQDMARKKRGFSPASLRTHCPKGHNYSGLNANGARICRICQLEATKRYNARRKNNV